MLKLGTYLPTGGEQMMGGADPGWDDVLAMARTAEEVGFDFVGVYERTNYRSMVSALRMGWRPCGTLYRVQVGSWMRLGRSAGARDVGMRLGPRVAEDRA